MDEYLTSRRNFLRLTAAALLGARSFDSITSRESLAAGPSLAASLNPQTAPPDYTLRIAANPIEIAAKHIVSTITYNGQFPGPLLRFKEGRPVTVEVHNDTDAPEQLHWHGQFVSPDVDGAAEEGTPFIPARGMRRITFTPKPSGLRFYHTHNRAGADIGHDVKREGGVGSGLGIE